jgi:uncharacterized tellurite resistance protein B-like protein
MMLEGIARFFRSSMDPEAAPDGEGRRRERVAICALLLEVSHADEEFSAAERDVVLSLVRERFGLDRAEAEELIRLALAERRQSTDLYQFTRLVDDTFTRAQKLTLLEELWRVVYADGQLEAHEDALMHKLANLLGLKHRELIALKLRVKDASGDR